MAFIKLYILFFSINMGMGITNAFLDDINSPASLTVATAAKVYNFTNPNDQTYLVANLTNPLNSTGDPANIFDESSDVAIFQPWTVLDFLDMAFIVNVLNALSTSIGIALPSDFMLYMYGLGGILFALFIVYLITGRGLSGFT